jgi:hypothetical protein
MMIMSLFLFIFANMNWRRIKKWAIIIAVIYVAIGVAFYFLQDRILFHPVSLKRNHNYDFKEPHKDLSIAINSEDTLNLVQFQSTDTITRGIVPIFMAIRRTFHGMQSIHLILPNMATMC